MQAAKDAELAATLAATAAKSAKTASAKSTATKTTKAKADDNRRTGRLSLSQALDGEGGRQRSLAAMKRKQENARAKALGLGQKAEKQVRDVQLPETITVQELANRMAERGADVIKSLIKMGMMVTANQAIDALVAGGVLKQTTIGRRHRAFEVVGLIDVLTEFERALAVPADSDGTRPARPVPRRRA